MFGRSPHLHILFFLEFAFLVKRRFTVGTEMRQALSFMHRADSEPRFFVQLLVENIARYMGLSELKQTATPGTNSNEALVSSRIGVA
jgi:hypothetical protein